MSSTNVKCKRQIQKPTLNVRYKRHFHVPHALISFESCWALRHPSTQVHIIQFRLNHVGLQIWMLDPFVLMGIPRSNCMFCCFCWCIATVSVTSMGFRWNGFLGSCLRSFSSFLPRICMAVFLLPYFVGGVAHRHKLNSAPSCSCCCCCCWFCCYWSCCCWWW